MSETKQKTETEEEASLPDLLPVTGRSLMKLSPSVKVTVMGDGEPAIRGMDREQKNRVQTVLRTPVTSERWGALERHLLRAWRFKTRRQQAEDKKQVANQALVAAIVQQTVEKLIQPALDRSLTSVQCHAVSLLEKHGPTSLFPVADVLAKVSAGISAAADQVAKQSIVVLTDLLLDHVANWTVDDLNKRLLVETKAIDQEISVFRSVQLAGALPPLAIGGQCPFFVGARATKTQTALRIQFHCWQRIMHFLTARDAYAATGRVNTAWFQFMYGLDVRKGIRHVVFDRPSRTERMCNEILVPGHQLTSATVLIDPTIQPTVLAPNQKRHIEECKLLVIVLPAQLTLFDWITAYLVTETWRTFPDDRNRVTHLHCAEIGQLPAKLVKRSQSCLGQLTVFCREAISSSDAEMASNWLFRNQITRAKGAVPAPDP